MKFLLFFILWAQILIQVQPVELESLKDCFTDRIHVYVKNNLPPNPHSLEAHCASGDDDLGHHKIGRNGDYHFTFCTSFWDNTLFFCHFWWYNKDQALVVYKTRNLKDDNRCHNNPCYYEARGDGVYYANSIGPKQNLTKLYNWNVHN